MAWPDPASCGRHFNAGDYPYVSIWRAVLRGQRQCRLDCRVAGVHRYVCRRPDWLTTTVPIVGSRAALGIRGVHGIRHSQPAHIRAFA